MKDYRIEVKVKNNILYKLMKSKGIETVAELARLSGVYNLAIYNYMNLKEIPYSNAKQSKEGEFKQTVLKLAEFLNVTPYEMFPVQHLAKPLFTNKAESELTLEEINQYILPGGDKPLLEDGLYEPEQIIFEDEKKDAVTNLLKTLSQSEETVMRLHYGLDSPSMSFKEIGEQMENRSSHGKRKGKKGISKSRVRQIFLTAERKLNHPSRKNVVSEFL